MEILTAVQEQQTKEAQNIVYNIVILQELKQFIPPLSPEESSKLESNILAEGIRDSIILWKTTSENYFKLCGLLPEAYSSSDYSGNKQDLDEYCYIIVDGHNRYSIAQKHNIDFSFDVYEFETIGTAKQFMINLQLGRRNLTPQQISYFRGLEYNSLKQQHGGAREQASNQNDNLTTAQTLAQKYKVGEATILRDKEFAEALDIIAAYNPELKLDIIKGNVRVNKQNLRSLPKIKEHRILNAQNFESEESLNDLLSKPLEIWENGEYKGEVKPAATKDKNKDFWKRQAEADKQAAQEVDFFDRVGEEREPEQKELNDLLKALGNAGVNVLVEIKGKFLIENNLSDYWKKLRQLDKAITLDFTDWITFGQAQTIGIITAQPREPAQGKEIERLKFDVDFYKTQAQDYINLLNEAKDELYNIQKSFKTNSTDERIKLTKKGFTLMRCNGEKITFFDAEVYSWKLYGKFETKAAAQERMKELKQDENINAIFE